MAYCKYKK